MATTGVVVAYPYQRPGGYGRVDNDVYYRTIVETLEAILVWNARAYRSTSRPVAPPVSSSESRAPANQ